MAITKKELETRLTEIFDEFGDIERTIEKIPSVITEGNLEVYCNDFVLRQADPIDHGIWIKDGKITKVY